MTELVPLVERVHVKVVKSTDDLLTTLVSVLLARLLRCASPSSPPRPCLRRLEHLDEEVISTGAGLIVLDSAASLIRKEWASRSSTRRTEILNRQAAILKFVVAPAPISSAPTPQSLRQY